MASLKELRSRINSVKSTRKITKAMQMVAAAKLKKAQEAAEAARPYSERMERVLGNLAQSMEGKPGGPPLLVGTGQDKTHLILVLTADKGLCGGFNSNIVRAARRRIDALLAEGKTVKLFTVGRKGNDVLRRLYKEKIVEYRDLSDEKTVSFNQAAAVGAKVLEMFAGGDFDVCTMFYSEFKSVMSQKPAEQRLIPASIPDTDGGAGMDLGGAVYDYEPEEEVILEELLPLNLNAQIFKALLENAAGEQGARMTAMDAATRNAGDLIDDLTLQYNRTRQAQITKELIEIISGAEAV